MATTFGDIKKFGIQKEIDAESFYRRWAGLVTGPERFWPRAKVLLLELAEQETKHQHFFENLEDHNIATGDIPETFNLRSEEYSAPGELRPDASTRDVIYCAINRENAAINFYAALAKLEGKARKAFDRLGEEEKGHKLRLEEFYTNHLLSWD